MACKHNITHGVQCQKCGGYGDRCNICSEYIDRECKCDTKHLKYL